MLSFMMCVWEWEAGTNSQRVHESLNLEKMGCHSASSTLHQPTQYYWFGMEKSEKYCPEKCVYVTRLNGHHPLFQNIKLVALCTSKHIYVKLPGSVARCHTSLTDSIAFSCGACITIVVEPTTQRMHPTTPKICSFSFKIKWASTALHGSNFQKKLQDAESAARSRGNNTIQFHTWL